VAGEGLDIDTATGGADIEGLETGAEIGFVERFGTGGEGWAIWNGNLDNGG